MVRGAVILLALAALLAPAAALKTVSDSESELQAYKLAEQDDERFLAAQWHLLEGELSELDSSIATQTTKHRHQVSDLQISAAPTAAKKPAEKKAVKAKVAEKKPAEANKAGIPADLAKKMPKGLMAKIDAATGGQASRAMLAPMLGMLEGLYQDQKKRISELNKREEVSKKRFEKQEADFKKQNGTILERFTAHKISEGFYVNETRDAARQFTYWQRCRERNHRQFHTSLKLTHATMEKEKTMMKAYQEAIASPTPTAKGAHDFAKISGQIAPEIVFAQLSETAKFCRTSMKQIHAQLGDLRRGVKQ